jgi:cobalt/nickel transport protein
MKAGAAGPAPARSVKLLDGFTKTMLLVMFLILAVIFGSAKYMTKHKMAAGGTDDAVNDLATGVARLEHHPFIELPGDAELGAFSVANFFAGMIVGHYWQKLFAKKEGPSSPGEGEARIK